MYSTELNLESNITPPVALVNRVAVKNYNNQNSLSQGDHLIVTLNYNDGRIEDEGSAGSLVDYTSEAGTLTAGVTGLDGTFNYNRTRTGWIYIHDGSAYKKCEVKQYAHQGYDSDANDASSVLEILTISSDNVLADYEWADVIAGWDANGVINTVIGGLGYFVDTTGINIGSNGTTVQASYTITANDALNLGGNDIFLTTIIRKDNASGDPIDTIYGSGSGSGTVVSTTSAIISTTDIGSADRIWIRTEISNVGIQ